MYIGVILSLIVALLWAQGEVGYSKISKKIDRANVYFYQFFFRTIIYSIVVAIFNFSIIGTFDIDKFYLFLPIILCDLVATYVVNIALANGKLSIVSPIMASYPVAVILFSLFFLKEEINLLELILIFIISIDIILLSGNNEKGKKKKTKLKGIFFASLYMNLIAMSTLFEKNIYNLSYTVYDFYYYKASTYFVVSMVFAFIIFITPVKIKKPNREIVRGSVLTPIGNVLYSIALSLSSILIVTPISSMYSSITSILSLKVLKEKVSLKERLCIASILISTFILIIIGLL